MGISSGNFFGVKPRLPPEYFDLVREKEDPSWMRYLRWCRPAKKGEEAAEGDKEKGDDGLLSDGAMDLTGSIEGFDPEAAKLYVITALDQPALQTLEQELLGLEEHGPPSLVAFQFLWPLLSSMPGILVMALHPHGTTYILQLARLGTIPDCVLQLLRNGNVANVTGLPAAGRLEPLSDDVEAPDHCIQPVDAPVPGHPVLAGWNVENTVLQKLSRLWDIVHDRVESLCVDLMQDATAHLRMALTGLFPVAHSLMLPGFLGPETGPQGERLAAQIHKSDWAVTELEMKQLWYAHKFVNGIKLVHQQFMWCGGCGHYRHQSRFSKHQRDSISNATRKCDFCLGELPMDLLQRRAVGAAWRTSHQGTVHLADRDPKWLYRHHRTQFSKDEVEEWYYYFDRNFPDLIITRQRFIQDNLQSHGGTEALWEVVFKSCALRGESHLDFREFLISMDLALNQLKDENILLCFDQLSNGQRRVLEPGHPPQPVISRESAETLFNHLSKIREAPKPPDAEEDFSDVLTGQDPKLRVNILFERFGNTDENTGEDIITRDEFVEGVHQDHGLLKIFVFAPEREKRHYDLLHDRWKAELEARTPQFRTD
eukprot:NODE_663_length_1869_cov_52.184066_g534_i0.p1 GENE.NODE_663_length_1869_cov_52.184066_g534_i0~~NODE_663_length_1869_cov_52.184066_g534_i0.p1  ORF type:complete len:597 (-),score=131.43 NODE_663_length_1869_cov_52.184066_g534_i0:31-1821(-)